MENCAEPIPLVRVFATRLQGPREGFSRSDTLYALPILNAQGKPRPLPQVALAIQRLLTVARNRRDRQFLIPSVGVAPDEGGYTREQIAPLFASAPANCRFMEAEYAAAIPRPKACYRVVIAGSRSLKDYAPVAAALDALLRLEKGVFEVVHGGTGGVDTWAGRWAHERDLPVTVMPALWHILQGPNVVRRTNRKGSVFNASAGLDRNLHMAAYGNRVIALWDGKSRGTQHMITLAKLLGRPVTVESVSHRHTDNLPTYQLMASLGT
ncbi:SLOG family protein [Acidiferrobacter thiooxydans]|nr:SLOG family protein [Acidiferrobacter thiooxydans]